MELSEAGKTTVAKESQSQKALSSILVTPSGMVMDFNLSQLMKAPLPMATREWGKTVLKQPVIKVFVAVSIRALQLLRLS